MAVNAREDIAYKGLFNFKVAGVEAIWLFVQTIEGKIVVCCCYRPPNRADIWDEFEFTSPGEIETMDTQTRSTMISTHAMDINV